MQDFYACKKEFLLLVGTNILMWNDADIKAAIELVVPFVKVANGEDASKRACMRFSLHNYVNDSFRRGSA